jgi:hypothetical protein
MAGSLVGSDEWEWIDATIRSSYCVLWKSPLGSHPAANRAAQLGSQLQDQDRSWSEQLTRCRLRDSVLSVALDHRSAECRCRPWFVEETCGCQCEIRVPGRVTCASGLHRRCRTSASEWLFGLGRSSRSRRKVSTKDNVSLSVDQNGPNRRTRFSQGLFHRGPTYRGATWTTWCGRHDRLEATGAPGRRTSGSTRSSDSCRAEAESWLESTCAGQHDIGDRQTRVRTVSH